MVWADDVDDVQLGAGAVGQVHGGTEGQFRLRGTIGGQYYLRGEDAHLRLRSDVVVGPHYWLEPRACATWGLPLPLFARFREEALSETGITPLTGFREFPLSAARFRSFAGP